MPTKHHWKQIKAPKTWRPKPGGEIIGTYLGRTKRDGSYGQYEVAVIETKSGYVVASGTRLIQLLDVGGIQPGAEIKIVFHGYAEPTPGHDYGMKLFDLYVRTTA